MPPAAAKMPNPTDLRPVPDPTTLTTQQLNTAIGLIKELFAVKFEAMDKAVLLLQDTFNRSPSINEVFLKHEERFSSTAKEFEDLKELLLAQINERFNKVAQQFELVERQRVEQKKDTKDAVDAALTAQKEAVKEQTTASERAIAKSEAFTTKQIDAIGAIIQSRDKGVDDKIDDLKSRVTAAESKTSVSDPAIGEAVKALISAVADLRRGASRGEGQSQGQQNVWGFIVAGIGVVVGIAALLAAFRPH
jgi:hypothetical protein